MEKFLIKYYFSKDLFVTRIVEAENKEEADKYSFHTGIIQFTDSKGIFYNFNSQDVILTSVSKAPATTTVRGFR